nr:MAG TPA: hypothetical protein [Caudoviricetes sp.]
MNSTKIKHRGNCHYENLLLQKSTLVLVRRCV